MSRMCFLTPDELLRLDAACAPVIQSFRDAAKFVGVYLVGSAMIRADYRDIDVRMIVDDKAFKRLTLGQPRVHRLLNVALSEMVDSAAGLRRPVDFQIQSMTEANSPEMNTTPRNPLGKRWGRDPAFIDAVHLPADTTEGGEDA